MTAISFGPAAARTAAAGRRATRRGGRLLLDVTMMLAVLTFAFLAVGPHLLPYRTVTMLTGSMRPTIPVGAVAVDVAEPVAALKPGQVISFHAPVDRRPVVTHRVTDVLHRDAQVLIRTRGDANTGADPWLAVVHGATVWRVRAVIPHLGSAIRILRSPLVHLALAWIAPAVVLVWLLIAIWSPPGRSPATPEGGEPWATGPAPSARLSSQSRSRSPSRAARQRPGQQRRRPHRLHWCSRRRHSRRPRR